jgi:hypothetical protein
VFWGVGAVMLGAEMGTLEDMVWIQGFFPFFFLFFVRFAVELSWRFKQKEKGAGKTLTKYGV